MSIQFKSLIREKAVNEGRGKAYRAYNIETAFKMFVAHVACIVFVIVSPGPLLFLEY